MICVRFSRSYGHSIALRYCDSFSIFEGTLLDENEKELATYDPFLCEWKPEGSLSYFDQVEFTTMEGWER